MWGGRGPRGKLPVTYTCVGITKLTTVESLHNSHTGTKENGRFKEVPAGRVSGGSFVEGEKLSGQKMDTTRLKKWWNIACVSKLTSSFSK